MFKKLGIGCLGLIGILVVLAIVANPSGGGGTKTAEFVSAGSEGDRSVSGEG